MRFEKRSQLPRHRYSCRNHHMAPLSAPYHLGLASLVETLQASQSFQNFYCSGRGNTRRIFF